MDMATAGYTPSGCQKDYDKCVKKQVYPEHECAFSRMVCLLRYCQGRATKRFRPHPYAATLFACVIQHKLPFGLVEFLQ
ncbi:hypothetical protein ScPMuIL_001514 [Solemya velum]